MSSPFYGAASCRTRVSSLNDKVQADTPEDKFLFGIGGPGNEPGRFEQPHGMAFNSQGDLHVADAGNQRFIRIDCGVIRDTVVV